MADSLLTICQNVADEVGLARPSTVIGNTDATAIRIYRHAVRTGTMLAAKKWHQLIKTHSFSTSASEPQYDFPSDFRSMVPNTIWNQTTDQPMFDISPQDWAYEKSAVTTTFHDRFRLLGDDAGPDVGERITIHPTPAGIETIYFEYYSKNWVASSGGTEKAAFTADTDTQIFDDELFTMGAIWRLLKTVGQAYGEEKADFDRLLEIRMAQSGATGKLHADGHTTPLSNIPDSGFG